MLNRLHAGGCLAATVFSLTTGAQQIADVPVPHHLVQVFIRDAISLDRLVRLDLDLAGCTALELPVKVVDVIATDTDITQLQRSGLGFEVAIRNLEDHHARELGRYGQQTLLTLTPPVGQGGMGGHYTLAQMEAILDSFANDHPALCAPKVSIGRSLEGRNVWMVKISDDVAVDQNEPEVYFDAVHHAREPVSMTATLQFMDELLAGYGTDPEATFIIDERELYFVTCVNPDGYEHNRRTNPGGGGMWRKNRRGDANSVWGVDLNRNYATGWSAPNGGNSTSRNSQTYRGTAPFSEPESTAIEAFLSSRSVTQVMSTHTYTEILLRPWGYQNGDPANAAEYVKVGDRATAGNGVQHGPASTLLYIAAGTTLDHAHVAHGALGWTPELGRSSEGGFWPTPPNQIAISDRHQHMFRQMALTGGPLLAVKSVRVTEAAGGNGDGRVEPGEDGLVRVTASNDGLVATPPAQLALSAISAGITIVVGQANLGSIPRLSEAANDVSPLRFSVPSNYQDPIVRLRLTLTGDGRTTTEDVVVPLDDPRIAIATDMERDHGFSRGATTARTGAWERAAPQQTTSGGQVIQPGSQHTPGGRLCWITDGRAGSSAGSYDVDRGYTDLLSPVFDLSHLALGEVGFWRWYADSRDDDAFEIWVSNDAGRTWTSMLRSSSRTGAWIEFRREIPIPLTSEMQFRMRARDDNASLVEAGVDDFAIRGIVPDGSITIASSGAIGSQIRAGINGPAGSTAHVLFSPWTVSPITIPGVDGDLLLDPALIINLPSVAIPSSGYADTDLAIPNVPGLRGANVHFQQLNVDGTHLRLGNLQTVVFR